MARFVIQERCPVGGCADCAWWSHGWHSRVLDPDEFVEFIADQLWHYFDARTGPGSGVYAEAIKSALDVLAGGNS